MQTEEDLSQASWLSSSPISPIQRRSLLRCMNTYLRPMLTANETSRKTERTAYFAETVVLINDAKPLVSSLDSDHRHSRHTLYKYSEYCA